VSSSVHLHARNPDGITRVFDLTIPFPYRFDPKRDPIDIILNENPVPIRERMPRLEKGVAAIIDKSLLKNTKDHFPDAGKLLASLP